MIDLTPIVSFFTYRSNGLPEDAGATPAEPVQPAQPITPAPPAFTADTPGSLFCVSRNSYRDWELAAREILIGRCNLERSEVSAIASGSLAMHNVVALIRAAHEAHASRFDNINMSTPRRANLDLWWIYFDYFGLGDVYRDYFDPDPCYGSLIFVPEPAAPICEAAEIALQPAAPPELEPTIEAVAPQPEPQPQPDPGSAPNAAPVAEAAPAIDAARVAELQAQLQTLINQTPQTINDLNLSGGRFVAMGRSLARLRNTARGYLHSNNITDLERQINILQRAINNANDELDRGQ